MSSSTDVVSALDVALRVAAALESLGCEYFIGGSLACSLQGEPRATNDIDLVVAMMPRHVRAFAELLWYREGGEVSSKQWRDIVEVLRVSGAEIDDQYLSMWAEKLRVEDLLTRAQAEAAAKLGSQ
ncbi:uncharacterized protein SOCE26_090880 [Sorangium cellulosum]|uniref:Uncharacterized protein n=1 Tax=Sorangium cellulosum TaxID=56 RepID=A0A2L0F7K5_SORCE|nr:hypothetical protein [Sorangium cellulosum]AUX47566.1 uncharacterized protein SOCE26_090880 [Sorangium cellulosum]